MSASKLPPHESDPFWPYGPSPILSMDGFPIDLRFRDLRADRLKRAKGQPSLSDKADPKSVTKGH
jgi:hypothetical protein